MRRLAKKSAIDIHEPIEAGVNNDSGSAMEWIQRSGTGAFSGPGEEPSGRECAPCLSGFFPGPSAYLDFDRTLAVLVGHVHRTSEAGVETVDRSEDLDRLFRIGQFVTDQRGFVRAGLAFRIARTRVPGGRHDGLVIRDFLVLDHDPVA